MSEFRVALPLANGTAVVMAWPDYRKMMMSRPVGSPGVAYDQMMRTGPHSRASRRSRSRSSPT
jgi:hypothetical protein